MRRRQLVHKLAELVGNDILTITDVRDAWPAHAVVRLDSSVVPIALFMGTITTSGRGRDDIERRFQNPASRDPIVIPSDRIPILAGLWLDDQYSEVPRPVIMVADALRRRDRRTRFSVFTKLNTLQTAGHHGWGEHENSSDEMIRCFLPTLFPVYVEMVMSDAFPEQHEMITIAEAAGIGSSEVETSVERARRVSMTLVRDRRFSNRVLSAYGRMCAMCGLNHGLVEGAHIYPVSAPDSVDEVWNGLALCSNHHAAFDRHLIWIDPESRELKLHARLLEGATKSAASKSFVEMTSSSLTEPSHVDERPTDAAFLQRYDYLAGQYDWAT